MYVICYNVFTLEGVQTNKVRLVIKLQRKVLSNDKKTFWTEFDSIPINSGTVRTLIKNKVLLNNFTNTYDKNVDYKFAGPLDEMKSLLEIYYKFRKYHTKTKVTQRPYLVRLNKFILQYRDIK